MDVISTTWSKYPILVGVGLLIIFTGVIVPIFKMWWLIAGLNTMPKESRDKMDLRYIERYFGIFFVSMGVLLTLNPFFWVWLEKPNYLGKSAILIILLHIITMFIFGGLKRKKINPQNPKED